MDKKSYDNGTDFSFVEQKVREVQTTIEYVCITTSKSTNNRKCCKNKQLSGTESVHHEDG